MITIKRMMKSGGSRILLGFCGWLLLLLDSSVPTTCHAFVPSHVLGGSSHKDTMSMSSKVRWMAANTNDKDDWNSHFHDLQGFFEHYGHTNVEKIYKRNDMTPSHITFRRWVQEQRLVLYNHPESFSPERRQKLEAVGMKPMQHKQPSTIANSHHASYDDNYVPLFVIDPTNRNRRIYASMWEQRWEDWYQRLHHFSREHGFANCNTKLGYRLDMRLAEWVQIQRENLHLGTIRHDRRTKLLQLGVTPLVIRNNHTGMAAGNATASS